MLFTAMLLKYVTTALLVRGILGTDSIKVPLHPPRMNIPSEDEVLVVLQKRKEQILLSTNEDVDGSQSGPGGDLPGLPPPALHRTPDLVSKQDA
jgi:hypothetical protein